MIAPPALNQYATLLAGHPVTVACQADSNPAFQPNVRGYTQWYGTDPSTPDFVQVIYLPTSTCNRLVAIITPPTRTSFRSKRHVNRIGSIVSPGEPSPAIDEGLNVEADGYALETILHEATHLRENSTDEARVESDTCKNQWQAVKPLGLPAWRATETLEAMMDAHLSSEVYPIDYLADGC